LLIERRTNADASIGREAPAACPPATAFSTTCMRR
jgi:hypothetical protein